MFKFVTGFVALMKMTEDVIKNFALFKHDLVANSC